MTGLKEENNKEDEIENELMKKEMGTSFCNPVLAIILVHNVIMMCASGMSIRFVPIFMSQYVKLSPFWVQANDCIKTLVGIYFVSMAQMLSNKYGKITTMMIMDLIGISLF